MISVIVPVYNVEKYIDKCVQSILKQTYKDFELILVDDGSTDNSGKICDAYAEQDNRVSVIHKENGGPSIARNVAVKTAKGEMITFIDSDDYVTRDYLDVLFSLEENYEVDISAVLMKKIDEDEIPSKKNIAPSPILLTGREALLDILYQKNLDTTPCGMLFKKEIVLSFPFPDGRFHEDDFTMFKYFEHANKVAVCPRISYYYVQHESSIMHTKSEKIMCDEIEAAENLVKYFENSDEEVKNAAMSKKFSNFCQILMNNPTLKRDNIGIYRKLSLYLRNTRWKIIKNTNCRLKNKIAALILIFGVDTFQMVGFVVNKLTRGNI